MQDSFILVGYFNTLENVKRAGLVERTSFDDEVIIIARIPNIEGKF